jgi:YNFM family putative membrane transporter
MSAIVTPAARTARPEKSFELAIFAVMIAGACTFLNVYCTQPLLPLFQRLFHASEIEVSMTVGAITLAVALMAPVTGLIAETIGRKKVIVPALFALAVPTLLAATSQSLHALIFWRFAQGLFVPGVIAVMMAYINEEFAGRVGTVMSAYVAGTVFGGFLGRFLVGIIAAHWNWRAAFVTLGNPGSVRGFGRAPMAAAGGSFCSRPNTCSSPRATRGGICGTRGCWRFAAWVSPSCFRWWACSPT